MSSSMSISNRMNMADVKGILVLLEPSAAALSSVVDAVAALSCEASRAPIKGAFDLKDSGDGNADNDAVAIASELTVLLNNSNLVNKDKSAAPEVVDIPIIHSSLRMAAKILHTNVRVWFNSVEKPASDAAFEKTVVGVLNHLANAIKCVGESSLARVKLNLDWVVDEHLRALLLCMFEENCPSRDINYGYELVLAADLRMDFQSYVLQLQVLLEMAWNVVTWEAITAFVSIEGVDSGEKGQSIDASRGDAKIEKQGDKKKKKKKVLGNGTEVLVQFIKDRLQKRTSDNATDGLIVLKTCIYALLDHKDTGFLSFVEKVKELVDSNARRRLPKLPKGTRDSGKEQMEIRKKAFKIIEGVFERHGASALDTPVFELRETLMGKYGEDSKLVYDLADQHGELYSLRYDLTVPFARYVAMNGITSYKRYQIGKVYRRDNPSKGRYREFYQCDFDIAGKLEQMGPMGPDIEVVRVLTELLDELDIGDYEIKLNHRKLLDAVLEICGVPADKCRTICSSIDKLDKQPFEQIKREMVEEKGLSVETAERIGNFVKERGSPLELCSKLKLKSSELLQSKDANLALNDLEILFKALKKAKCINKIVFDLSLARGLDYYTGVIFEAVFKGTTQVGSIAAGGRYDNLIGMFGSKQQVPAVGVSLGIERVLTIMELQKERNENIRATKTQVLVSILGNDVSEAIELASELWDAKLEAEFMVNKSLDKHIKFALGLRVPWMVLVGERERNAGVVELKGLETRQQFEVPRSRIVDELKIRLKR